MKLGDLIRICFFIVVLFLLCGGSRSAWAQGQDDSAPQDQYSGEGGLTSGERGADTI